LNVPPQIGAGLAAHSTASDLDAFDSTNSETESVLKGVGCSGGEWLFFFFFFFFFISLFFRVRHCNCVCRSRLVRSSQTAGKERRICSCPLFSSSFFLLQVKGGVLVTSYTDPSWSPLFSLCSAVILVDGGVLSHAAVVAREMKERKQEGKERNFSHLKHADSLCCWHQERSFIARENAHSERKQRNRCRFIRQKMKNFKKRKEVFFFFFFCVVSFALVVPHVGRR
jgi:hypothetical protein